MPEGRQDLTAVIAEMQECVADRNGLPRSSHQIGKWLALLLVEAPQKHAIETALREVVTNGEWRGGVEWVISTAVYEMAAEALTDSPIPAPVTLTPPQDWYPIENPPHDGEYVLLVSPAHGRVIGAHISGDVWHLIGVGAITSASERPTHWQPLPTAPLAGSPKEPT